MGAIKAALIGAASGLGVPRDSLGPQKQGVPVYSSHHYESKKRIRHCETSQTRALQRQPPPDQGAGQGPLAVNVVVDLNPQVAAGEMKTEIESDIDVGERGDVKLLRAAQMKSFSWRPRNQVRFRFAEGIGYFGDGCEGISLFRGAEVKGDRVEAVPDDSRERDKLNPPFPKCDLVVGEKGADTFLQGSSRRDLGAGARGYGLVEGQIVAFSPREEPRLIEPKSSYSQGADLIEVEREIEKGVAETVHSRVKTMMQHLTGVET